MLLNTKILSQYSPLPKNYNFDEIMLYQPIAISLWIKPVLGEEFLDELETQVANNNITPENATLLTTGGLLQYLAYAMVYEGLPFIYADFNEAGITIPDMDFSKSVDLKQLNYIQDHLRRTLEYLKDEVIKFLDDHFESFPLYCSHCGCCNDAPKLKKPNPMFTVYRTRPIPTDII